ncbi:GNAT family N-acetyltransferase [Streptomyces mobaraensis]|uniref:GNAT family N-acetyltransferase n=1 Tax=Streptomyces mobaraensis TaxID=35621 RepID=A0A5N5VZP7_STRMB|nr:GNAT family N-acetyltransferase [Streptomyces mobaraensis]KAB7833688.1 GNAT family N-acetyltransferase [Streptomyces mobaraensis]
MPQTTVRPLHPDEWRLYRSVRLAALADAPEAFGSTWAAEHAFTERKWRERLARRNTFLAERDDAPCGLTSVLLTDPRAAELVSFWVAPTARGSGAADLLLDAALGHAAAHARTELRLWVAAGNDRAERFYRRRGFTRTGESQPVRPDEPRLEYAMTRPTTDG